VVLLARTIFKSPIVVLVTLATQVAHLDQLPANVIGALLTTTSTLIWIWIPSKLFAEVQE